MAAHRLHRAPRSFVPSGRNLRALVAVLAAIATVLTLGGVAFAYLTATGTGTGSATTGTLNPPTAVSGSQVTHTSTVNVSWTAPSSGSTPTGYYVLRTPSPSGVTVAACGTSAATPTINTSCVDAAVPNGTFTYVVVALFYTWTATSAPSDVVTVVETNQSITFTSSPSAPTVGDTYGVTATGGGSGNPVTFSSATPGVCTVAGSNVSLNHAGTCTINADQAGNAQYNPAPQVQQSFTVAKAPQTITFTSTAPSGAVVGGPAYTPAATGGASGNPVTFTIDASTAANCSISGGDVTFQHAGSCTVNANQAGDADHLPASQVQQSFAIGQGSQAITYTSTAPTDAKVSGPTYTVTATGGASGNAVTFSSATPTICSVSGSTVSFLLAGTCTVNANQAGNADYLAAAQVQQSFLVTKTDQTITFTSTAPSSATYQGPTYTPTATATSGLTVAFAIDPSSSGVCTINGVGVVSFTGVGTCTINATQAGNTVYNPAPFVQQSFTVGKAAQTITWNGPLPAKTFGDAPFTLSPQATASSGLPVAYSTFVTDVCTVSGTTVTIVGAGACTIAANQPGNSLYLPATQVIMGFGVSRASQTITLAQPASPATALTTATLSFSASSGLPVSISTNDVCSVSGTTVTYLKAGNCLLMAAQAGNANYAPAPFVGRTVTVDPAPQTITFNQPATPANAGTNATLVATASSGLTVAFTTPSAASICTISGTTVTYVGAGSCVINANQAGNDVYSAAAQVQRTVVVAAVDSTGPSITSIDPTNGKSGNNWNQVDCNAVGGRICANVTDGTGVASVTYCLRRVSTGLYWNGTSFSLASCTPRTMTLDTGSRYISENISNGSMPSGSFTLVITATDSAPGANVTVSPTVTFTIN